MSAIKPDRKTQSDEGEEGGSMRSRRRSSSVLLFVVVVLAATLAGAGAGLIGARATATTFTSTAQLVWDPSIARYANSSAYVPDSVSLGIQLGAQSQVAQSDEVMSSAAKTLGEESNILAEHVTAATDTTASTITITATAGTAEGAQRTANAVVTAYRAYVADAFNQQFAAQAAALDAPISALKSQLDSATSTDLQSSLAAQIATLSAQQQIAKGDATNAITPLSETRAAQLAAKPTSPTLTTMVAVGAALGLLISLVFLGVLRYRRAPVTLPERHAHAERVSV